MSAITEMPVNVLCEAVKPKLEAYGAFDVGQFEKSGGFTPDNRIIDGETFRYLRSDTINEIKFDAYYCDDTEDYRLLDSMGNPVLLDWWHRDIVQRDVDRWIEEETSNGFGFGDDDD